MVLWWFLNVVLLAVIVPVVVLLLRGVVLVAVDIKRTTGALEVTAPVLVEYSDEIGQLAHTQELVHETTAGLARYGAALDRIL
jgi:hypothetical protein